MRRKLGRSGIEVSAVGMGCWAIGGPAWRDEKPVGWGDVEDADSLQAIARALDLGVNFFDTADCYGAGHSERILGKALKGQREKAVIATKFGVRYDENTRKLSDGEPTPDYIRQACDASLKRLGTDHIDLYQFHKADYDADKAVEVRQTLEELVEAGKIRYYGWSTDDPERAACFAEGAHCVAIQQHLNVFGGNFETLKLCEQKDLASINRGPLAMGILTGKFDKKSKLPENDVRSGFNFQAGTHAEQLEKVDAIRSELTAGGRTPAQGALAWLWARSEKTIPIPGFKAAEQVEDNAGAMEKGPLTDDQMEAIASVIER